MTEDRPGKTRDAGKHPAGGGHGRGRKNFERVIQFKRCTVVIGLWRFIRQRRPGRGRLPSSLGTGFYAPCTPPLRPAPDSSDLFVQNCFCPPGVPVTDDAAAAPLSHETTCRSSRELYAPNQGGSNWRLMQSMDPPRSERSPAHPPAPPRSLATTRVLLLNCCPPTFPTPSVRIRFSDFFFPIPT